jgi:hypothetical protein
MSNPYNAEKNGVIIEVEELFGGVATKLADGTILNADTLDQLWEKYFNLVKPLEVVEEAPQPAGPKGAPLENSREGHPFDLFGGTSWAGKKNPF